MEQILAAILKQVEESNPMLAKLLRNEVEFIDSEFPDMQKHLLEKLLSFLKIRGKDLKYGVECLLKKYDDLFEEGLKFYRTGKYSYNSFEQVNEAVYNNPYVMEYHTIGLLMLELLTSMGYIKLQFLIEILQSLPYKISRYLEIGGGHGMYLWEAEKILSKDVIFDIVDISETSIEIAKVFLQNIPVNYYHKDIFEFTAPTGYDFISMCEILEHLENPGELLCKAKTFLNADGRIFITTPINNPTIDHIYLFENVEQVRSLLYENGLTIINEKSAPWNNMTINEAERKKIPIDYFALVKCR